MAIAEGHSAAERRVDTRIHMHILGSFITDSIGATACEIHDIAPGGVRLAASRLPKEKDRIGLNIPALGRFVGVVAWVDGNEFGVQFTGSAKARPLATEISARRSRERLKLSGNTDATLVLLRENGSQSPVSLAKMTVDGASFICEDAPEVGEIVRIADMPATVFKVVNEQFAVRFHPPRETDPLLI